MITVEIPIKDKRKPPVLRFPDRCVHCGKPSYKVWPIKLNMGVQKRGHGVTMDLPLPLCEECDKKERKVTNVTLVPFLVAGLIFFVIVFIPVWLILPDGTTPQTLGFAPLMGVFAGLLAGLLGGSVVEYVLKFVFASFYGLFLLKRPLTVASLFSDSEDVIGLSARFTGNKKSLMLNFENNEIAEEFKSMNSEVKFEI